MTDRGNGDAAGGKWHPLAVAVLSALLASGGTIGVVFNTSAGEQLARPDPFTGSQGASLEARVEHIEKDLNDHVLRHPSDENQFDRRIATLEAQYAIILQNQARILDRLDKR